MRPQKIKTGTFDGPHYLRETDDCYAIGEFTAGKGYQGGRVNQHILNLKILPSAAENRQYYRNQSIAECARWIREILAKESFLRMTWVPVPPSRMKDDPDYNDKLADVLRAVHPGEAPDIRDMLVQTRKTRQSHTSGPGHRLSPDELRTVLEIDHDLLEPVPELIVIFDDVMTTGAHYIVAHDLIREAYRDRPGIKIEGLFLARCVWLD